MPKLPQFEITEVPGGYKIEVPASLSKSGKRERYIRAKEKDAKRLQRQFKKLYHEFGTKAGIIDPALASMAVEAQELLAPFGANLLDAAREYAEKRKAEGSLKTLREAWAEYRDYLIAAGRSEATLTDYSRTEKSLPEWFLDMEVAKINGPDMERGLDASIKRATGKRGTTWNRRLRETRAVINHATSTDAKQVSTRRKDPDIIHAAQVAKLMKAAEAEGCALPFALMVFAGIRPQGELSRITWSAIKKDHIVISGEESKTSTDRIIPVMPNLKLWIEAHRGQSIEPTDWEKKRKRVRRAGGISGLQDVLRHTFGSAFYRLHGLHETTEAMGNSVQVFLKHYKRSMTIPQAQAIFRIAPGGKKVAKPKVLRAA